MGFSGGGSGALLNHEHDGTLVADGGPLNFLNITQSSMSAGSITQSDGTHLQELVIGNPAQVLEVNPAGTAVAWTDIAVKRVLLDDHVAVGTASSYTFTPASAISSADYSRIDIVFKVALTANSNSLNMTINGVSTYWYYANFNYQSSASNTWTDSVAVATFELASSAFTTSSGGLVGTAEIIMAADLVAGNPETAVRSFASQSAPVMWEDHTGVNLNTTGGNLTSITFTTPTTTWIAGSEFMIYGVLR